MTNRERALHYITETLNMSAAPWEVDALTALLDAAEERGRREERAACTLIVKLSCRYKGLAEELVRRIRSRGKFRTCAFCGCQTNAEVRACCDKGREEDRGE